MLWGVGGSSPATSSGAPGHPWLHGAAKPWGPALARQKFSNPIFYHTNLLLCWNFGSNLQVPQLCPLGCVWFGRRGDQGSVPTCGGCQMCWLLSGCLPAPSGRGRGWRADGGEITPPRHSDKDDLALPLIKRLILEFEIGI